MTRPRPNNRAEIQNIASHCIGLTNTTRLEQDRPQSSAKSDTAIWIHSEKTSDLRCRLLIHFRVDADVGGRRTNSVSWCLPNKVLVPPWWWLVAVVVCSTVQPKLCCGIRTAADLNLANGTLWYLSFFFCVEKDTFLGRNPNVVAAGCRGLIIPVRKREKKTQILVSIQTDASVITK